MNYTYDTNNIRISTGETSLNSIAEKLSPNYNFRMTKGGNLAINNIYVNKNTDEFNPAPTESVDIDRFILYLPIPSRYVRKGDIVRYNEKIYYVSAVDSLYVSLIDWLDRTVIDVAHNDLDDFELIYNWAGTPAIHGEWVVYKAFLKTQINFIIQTLYPDFYDKYIKEMGNYVNVTTFAYDMLKNLIETRCEDILL